MHRLSQLGYIDSSKGKGGGIRIAREPDAMKLGDLVRALEPNMDLVECFNKDTNTCRIASACQLKHYLHDAAMDFLTSLNRHTLADTVVSKELFKITISSEAK